MLSAGLLVAPQLFAYNKKYIGLQLYTVRDAMAKDPAATLAKVAQIGYNSVECATYTGTENFYGMDAKSFAALIKQNGLIIPSGHFRLGEDAPKGVETKGTILHGWDKAIDDAGELGWQDRALCAQTDPEALQAQTALGDILAQLGRKDEAQSAYAKALTISAEMEPSSKIEWADQIGKKISSLAAHSQH